MKPLSPTGRSFLLLNAAFLLWGITPLFAKLISIQVNALICLRCLVGAITLAVLLRLRQGSFALASRRDYPLAIITGVLMGLHWVLYFHSIRASSVAIATIALCTGPMMTILLEPLIARERLHYRDLLTGGLVFIGIYILIPRFRMSDGVTQGVLLGIASALLFSLRSIFSRQLVRKNDSTLVMFYQILATFLMLAPTLLLDPPEFQGYDIAHLLVLGIFFTAISHALYIASLRGLRAKTAGILQPLVPVYSTFFAMLLMGDVPTVRTLLGGAIVLCSAIYETAAGHRK